MPGVDSTVLLGLVAATPDMPGAACVGAHSVYDAAANGDADAQAIAVDICSSCRHCIECSEWAASLTARERQGLGVVGGTCYTAAKHSPGAPVGNVNRTQSESSCTPRSSPNGARPDRQDRGDESSAEIGRSESTAQRLAEWARARRAARQSSVAS